MSRNFSEKFADLINLNVPRTFMQDKCIIGSDIPTIHPALETNELPNPPDDGFIATYCSDNR